MEDLFNGLLIIRVECDVVASNMHVVREFLMCFLKTFGTCLQSEKLTFS